MATEIFVTWSYALADNDDGFLLQRSVDSGSTWPVNLFYPSSSTHYTDTSVARGNTYSYHVAGINQWGTGSFSNVGSVYVPTTGSLSCTGVDFIPYEYSEVLTTGSYTSYRNTYGVLIPFTTSVSKSISVWARSPDFDVYITLIDSQGNVLIENDDGGWNTATGSYGTGYNAAFAYNLPSGSYTFEVSSYDNAVGRYLLTISPGPRLETTWSNAYEPYTLDYISSSNYVVIGDNAGGKVVFYDTVNNTLTTHSYSNTYGACYSPTQDKAYAWIFSNGSASIAEFDNTGSFIRSASVASANVDGDVYNWNGYLSYDKFNDKILLVEDSFRTTQSVVIWDCAAFSRSALLNIAAYRGNALWQSTYSEINNSYYISQQSYLPMIKINAATHAITNSLVSSEIIVSYISSSNLLMIRGAGDKVQFVNPVTDAIVHTQSDIPNLNGGLLEAGGDAEDCANVYAFAVDPWVTPNNPSLYLIDRDTYLPQNCLVFNTGSNVSDWWQYSIALSENNSRIYSAQSDYADGRLYSIRVSRVSSDYSADIAPAAGTPPPAAPSDFIVYQNGSGSASLSWTDNSSNETEFHIIRTWTAYGGGSNGTMTASAGAVSYIDTPPVTATIDGRTQYRYSIQAYSGSNKYSAYVNSNYIDMYGTLSVPELVVSSGSIQLNWSSSTNPSSSTIIERSTGSSYVQIYTAGYDTTSYVDTNVTDSNSNFYQYRAYRSSSMGIPTSSYSTSSFVAFSLQRAVWANNFVSSSCRKFSITSGSGTFGFTSSVGGSPCNINTVEAYTTILNTGAEYYLSASFPWTNDGNYFYHSAFPPEDPYDSVQFTMSINGIIAPKTSSLGGTASGSVGISSSWTSNVVGRMDGYAMNVITMSITCLSAPAPASNYLSTFSSGALTVRPLAHP